MVSVTCCYVSRRPASIDLKMCNRRARLARSGILNKLNSFSGIGFTRPFRRDAESAAFVSECFWSGLQGQLAPYFVGFLSGARRGT